MFLTRWNWRTFDQIKVRTNFHILLAPHLFLFLTLLLTFSNHPYCLFLFILVWLSLLSILHKPPKLIFFNVLLFIYFNYFSVFLLFSMFIIFVPFQLFVYLFINWFTYLFIHLFVYLFIYLFIYSFIYLFIYSFICLFIF